MKHIARRWSPSHLLRPLLSGLPLRRLTFDVIMLGTTVSACAGGLAWPTVATLMEDLRRYHLEAPGPGVSLVRRAL